MNNIPPKKTLRFTYLDPTVYGKALNQVIDEMKGHGLVNEKTTIDDVGEYALRHIKIQIKEDIDK